MSICPRCAAQFSCAMADQTGEPCWCTRLPAEPVLPIYPDIQQEQARCFCPVCMQAWCDRKEQSASQPTNQGN